VTALAEGRPPGFGTPTADPIVLVCTHGRRDVCCARLGRPLAVQLDRQLPGQVWETTHVGGDRYAPNVVALPHGTYHGGVSVGDVPALADAVPAGRAVLSRLRGRAGLPAPVQAADHFLREHLSVDDVNTIRPVTSTPSASGETCVQLPCGAGRVHVRSSQSDRPRLTSCAGDGTADRPTSFELVDLVRLDDRSPAARPPAT
jgi:hypothetical protein